MTMLPGAFILLVAVGLAAATAAGYNNDGYNSGYPSDSNRYRNYQNYQYNPSNNQDMNQRYPGYAGQNYDVNDRYDSRNYENSRLSGYNGRYNSNVYTKNETAIFCYVNGSRVDTRSPYTLPSLNALDIDVKLCTHLIVGAAMIHPNTYTMHVFNEDFLREGPGKLSFNNLSDMRKDNPNLKLLVSISGNPDTFLTMAKSNQHRDNFVTSVYEFLNRYNYGLGVNIDWQWPGGRDSIEETDIYFTFLKSLKAKIRGISLSSTSSSHDLSIFIPPERQQMSNILQSAERNGMQEYIDYYILMALELRGHYSQRIEHHAPIDSYVSGQTVRKAIDDVRSYVPREMYYKFILAIPFYGKRYTLDARTHDSPMNKPFVKQQTIYREVVSHNPYSQICKEVSNRGFTIGYDKRNECPYALVETNVIVYEDTESVRAKTRLALQSGFGGVMAYSIEMDDFAGECGRRSTNYDRNYQNSYTSSDWESKFPLLRAIHHQVQRGNAALFHSSPLAIAFAIICAFILQANNN